MCERYVHIYAVYYIYIYIYLPWISANFTRMPKKARVLRISIMLLIEYVNLVCNLYNFHEVSPTYRGSHTCLTFTAAYINDSWSIWRKRQRHLCSDRQPINSVMQMLLYIIIDDVLSVPKNIWFTDWRLKFYLSYFWLFPQIFADRKYYVCLIRIPLFSFCFFHLLISFICQAELINFQKISDDKLSYI